MYMMCNVHMDPMSSPHTITLPFKYVARTWKLELEKPMMFWWTKFMFGGKAEESVSVTTQQLPSGQFAETTVSIAL